MVLLDRAGLPPDDDDPPEVVYHIDYHLGRCCAVRFEGIDVEYDADDVLGIARGFIGNTREGIWAIVEAASEDE